MVYWQLPFFLAEYNVQRWETMRVLGCVILTGHMSQITQPRAQLVAHPWPRIRYQERKERRAFRDLGEVVGISVCVLCPLCVSMDIHSSCPLSLPPSPIHNDVDHDTIPVI